MNLNLYQFKVDSQIGMLLIFPLFSYLTNSFAPIFFLKSAKFDIRNFL